MFQKQEHNFKLIIFIRQAMSSSQIKLNNLLAAFLFICLLICHSETFQIQSAQVNLKKQTANDILLHNPPLNPNELMQKGNAITQQFEDQIKSIIQQSYLFYRLDCKAVQYIYSKINQKQVGAWFVTILIPGASSPLQPGQNFDLSTYSIDGNWWIYWKGGNHYQPQVAYFLSKMDSNQRASYVSASVNPTFTPHFSSTFSNLVNALQMESPDISSQIKAIDQNLHNLSSKSSVNVYLGASSINFCTTQWGISSLDFTYMNATTKMKYRVATTPYV